MFLLGQKLPFSQKHKQHQQIILARRAHHQIISSSVDSVLFVSLEEQKTEGAWNC
jgi:hypothetical protein